MSILEPNAPAPAKVARMYLLSDLLHNSSAPVKNASTYRTLLQTHLPDIVQNLGVWKKGLLGRLTSGQFDERINALFVIWEQWAIFSPFYLTGLEAIFNRTENEIKKYNEMFPDSDDTMMAAVADIEGLRRNAKAAGIAIVMDSSYYSNGGYREEAVEHVDGKILFRALSYVRDFTRKKALASGDGSLSYLSLPDMTSVPHVGEDIDGDDIDGAPMDGIPLDTQLAGEADDDIDGVPLDDDLDGVPLDEEQLNLLTTHHAAASKRKRSPSRSQSSSSRSSHSSRSSRSSRSSSRSYSRSGSSDSYSSSSDRDDRNTSSNKRGRRNCRSSSNSRG
jgi:U2-associated protein SR140